jgi:hypothetical protein
MATFILTCFVVFVLALIARFIYEVQQNKKQNKIEDTDSLDYVGGPTASFMTPEEMDKFQTLAGIKGGPTRSLSVDELKKEFENTQFPAPDPSIPVVTAKLTTIGGNYGDSDPLAQIPMSRVSKEGKRKMAEIAKQDIAKQVEVNAENIAKLQPKVEPNPKKKTAKPKVTKAAPKKKATKKKKENE